MGSDAANARAVFEAVLDLALHERMRADVVRCRAFEDAISRRVRGKVVLDIGTGPFALLALHCARAGAARVYAVEVVPRWAAMAREAVATANFSDVVEVFDGYSTDVRLPGKVDVVVHEILGNIASEEGVVPCLRDARSRLVQDPGKSWSIPDSAQTWVAPTAFPVIVEDGEQQPPQRRTYRLDEFPEDLLLADPQVWEDLQFCHPLPASTDVTLRFRASRAGRLSGVVNHMTVLFDNEGRSRIDTLRQRTTWRVVVVLFGRSILVARGDSLAVKCTADVHAFPPKYRFDIWLHPGTPQELYFDGQTVALRM